jgi:hypothetical protein
LGWSYALSKARTFQRSGYHLDGSTQLIQNFIEALHDLETQANELMHSIHSQTANGAHEENGSSPKEQHPLYSFLKVSKHALSTNS